LRLEFFGSLNRTVCAQTVLVDCEKELEVARVNATEQQALLRRLLAMLSTFSREWGLPVLQGDSNLVWPDLGTAMEKVR
jgi:hypothetical protein